VWKNFFNAAPSEREVKKEEEKCVESVHMLRVRRFDKKKKKSERERETLIRFAVDAEAVPIKLLAVLIGFRLHP